ncbi:MAG: hypothetical protein KBT15_10210 [Bacteroidales bacterium]|nr:hypothetical protein [Candidatus Minthousia equi]
MRLILKRELIFPDAIHGKIYYRGVSVCCTLEKPGHTLPAGVYKLKFAKADDEDEFLTGYLYRTHSNVRYSVCTMTRGNGVKNLNNCTIFIGKYQTRGLVIQGEKYLKHLNDFIITKRENEKESVKLKIVLAAQTEEKDNYKNLFYEPFQKFQTRRIHKK